MQKRIICLTRTWESQASGSFFLDWVKLWNKWSSLCKWRYYILMFKSSLLKIHIQGVMGYWDGLYFKIINMEKNLGYETGKLQLQKAPCSISWAKHFPSILHSQCTKHNSVDSSGIPTHTLFGWSTSNQGQSAWEEQNSCAHQTWKDR